MSHRVDKDAAKSHPLFGELAAAQTVHMPLDEPRIIYVQVDNFRPGPMIGWFPWEYRINDQ
jgi:hypothetical protein